MTSAQTHSTSSFDSSLTNTIHVTGSTKVVQNSTPKKKMCCACPDSKKARDECIVLNGEEACKSFIEAHKMCLRSEGFNV